MDVFFLPKGPCMLSGLAQPSMELCDFDVFHFDVFQCVWILAPHDRVGCQHFLLPTVTSRVCLGPVVQMPLDVHNHFFQLCEGKVCLPPCLVQGLFYLSYDPFVHTAPPRRLCQVKLLADFPRGEIVLQLFVLPDFSNPICCCFKHHCVVWDD